ncbi:PREDICTED: histone-lysine N-methyltransferase SETMAR-like [Acromyrmex echinatior]|uniref:histone-lysine N-methyltransferase SETMAR-like n=1 Tax=Acromyrmex echinatior TaxID=103372 RepID=UPI000580D91D|nr:PREDICTED: histone-lysine N-methyltransferase SETMAR-like [Acromyrmex echinatior]
MVDMGLQREEAREHEEETYYYDKGKNAAQAYEKICAIYGEDTLSKSITRKWFACFRTGNFDVKDKSRSGRPITKKSDEIMKKVERDKYCGDCQGTRHDYKTVLNHLHKAGYKKKLDVWNEFEPFLKRMIIGDEKWITYDNRTRKRLWIKEGEKAQVIAKSGLTTKKVVFVVELEGNRSL